jgi:hypothetical protein
MKVRTNLRAGAARLGGCSGGGGTRTTGCTGGGGGTRTFLI